MVKEGRGARNDNAHPLEIIGRNGDCGLGRVRERFQSVDIDDPQAVAGIGDHTLCLQLAQGARQRVEAHIEVLGNDTRRELVGDEVGVAALVGAKARHGRDE